MTYVRRGARWASALSVVLLAATGCSSVHQLYVPKKYVVDAPSTVRRLAVVAWAPPEHQALAATLAHVAADLVKLRKNYLVLSADAVQSPGALPCAAPNEGVLSVRVLDVERAGVHDSLHLELSVELLRCRDGMLAFRSAGDRWGHSDDASLSDVVDNYRMALGDSAAPYIAPSFALLQELIEPMPNPTLSESDIEEKIELGSAAPPSL